MTAEATAEFNKKYRRGKKKEGLTAHELMHLHEATLDEALSLMEVQKHYPEIENFPARPNQTTWQTLQNKIEKKNSLCKKLDQLLSDKMVIK